MSWLYSQVLVEAFLEDTSLDGEQCVQSSGSSTPQAYCAPDKMTGFSRLSRFGMTYKPLTESRGEELLTLYREAFHAKTSQPQGKVSESMGKEVGCGEKWRGSFTKYDPDSSMWRTHQCSLLGDLEPFSETWPQWGLMRNGECWEQTTLERTIRGTGYGFEERLPTPTASDYKNQPTSASWKAKGAINYKLSNPEIQAKWATPTTMDKLPPKSAQALYKEATQARPGRSKPANLRDQVSNMQNWPTPNAWDGKRGPRSEENLRTKKHQINLITAVKQAEREKMLPTPNARDWKDGKTAGNRKSPGLGVVAHQLDTQTGGQLNPTWVEWLMGWPLGWSELKPLEMDKSHFVPQVHGES